MLRAALESAEGRGDNNDAFRFSAPCDAEDDGGGCCEEELARD